MSELLNGCCSKWWWLLRDDFGCGLVGFCSSPHRILRVVSLSLCDRSSICLASFDVIFFIDQGNVDDHVLVISLEVTTEVAREMVVGLASLWNGNAFHSTKLVKSLWVKWINEKEFRWSMLFGSVWISLGESLFLVWFFQNNECRCLLSTTRVRPRLPSRHWIGDPELSLTTKLTMDICPIKELTKLIFRESYFGGFQLWVVLLGSGLMLGLASFERKLEMSSQQQPGRSSRWG